MKPPDRVLDVPTALIKGDYKQLQHLVESGGDVNQRDEDKRTPLILCCLHDGQKWAGGAARILLTFGAKVSLCDEKERNALMYAIIYRREELVKLFLDAADFDLGHTDKWNHTALFYATSIGNIVISTMLIKVLRKYGFMPAKVEAKKTDMDTMDWKLPPPIHSPDLTVKPLEESSSSSCTMNILPMEERYNNIWCNLPYKPIPADVWEKRFKFYNTEKQENSCVSLTKVGPDIDIKETTPVETSTKEKDWRDTFQEIIVLQEIKLCSSYRRATTILPTISAPLPHPLIPKRKDVKIHKSKNKSLVRKASSLSKAGRKQDNG